MTDYAYKCKYCNEKFPSAKEWTEHTQSHANDPSERYDFNIIFRLLNVERKKGVSFKL